METLEAIHTRRSIRQYSNKKIPKDVVDKILRAAMMAPSAGNNQPWHFIVIDDPTLLRKIPEIHSHAAMASQADLAILVCGQPEVEQYKDYWPQDCSAAMQNLLLAAHDLGLGAVWCGIYPRQERVEKFRKLFGIPKKAFPLGLVPMGYPATKPEKVDRFKQERVHRNRW